MMELSTLEETKTLNNGILVFSLTGILSALLDWEHVARVVLTLTFVTSQNEWQTVGFCLVAELYTVFKLTVGFIFLSLSKVDMEIVTIASAITKIYSQQWP